MKIIYMGTPDFAVPALQTLAAAHDVIAVYTQPDRPSGRGKKLTPSPIKTTAANLNIPVLQPLTKKEITLAPCDVCIVCAYGIILPPAVLSAPRLGCLNIHASLLPEYRGASPIHAALLAGDSTTGITIMQMDKGLDTGDIITKKSIPIAPTETFNSLHDRLATLGSQLILEALTIPTRTPQDNTQSSYAGLIKKSHGHILPTHSTQQILNMLRAYEAWPGVHTTYNDRTVRLWSATPTTSQGADCIKTSDGYLQILELQPQGGRRMMMAEYMRGR